MKPKLTHIQWTDVIKTFGNKRHQKCVLDHVDVELHGGELVLLSGKNGSGKSTLLRIMAGLVKPDQATINTGLEARSWKQCRKILQREVMYLYQEPYMFDGSVYRNLAYALDTSRQTYKIKQALDWAGLASQANMSAKCLSGGERQRVALAQAWLKQPSVLLLDEPTANMDDASRRRTEELLLAFKEHGTALFIASHDPTHFEQSMDHHLQLTEGSLKPARPDQTTDAHSSKNSHNNITPFPLTDVRQPHD